jgi:hypothetical protein
MAKRKETGPALVYILTVLVAKVSAASLRYASQPPTPFHSLAGADGSPLSSPPAMRAVTGFVC